MTPRIERASAQDVSVAGGRIERIGPAAMQTELSMFKEYSGMYVLPGLVDVISTRIARSTLDKMVLRGY
jgi:dihydroorotase-like cyclic amidohydrolase